MITLGPTQDIRATAGTNTAITCTLFGDAVTAGVDAFQVLDQRVLSTSIVTLFAATVQTLIKLVTLANTTASPVTGVLLYINGAVAANALNGGLTIPANGSASILGGQWEVYNSAGQRIASGVTSVFGRDGIVVAATSDYDAVQVDFTPAAGIGATNVQAAIEEVVSDAAAAFVPLARTVTAGAGMTGGGTLAADRTFNVVANADGSIAVNADDIQVGVINATQHGNQTNGTIHAAATAHTAGGFSGSGGVAGFLPASYRTSLGNFFLGAGAFYNVKDYGAVANDTLGAGGTDNSAAFQAAIDAAEAAGGGIVFVPAGRYSIQTGLTIQQNGVTLMGIGCSYTTDVGDYTLSGGSWIVWRGAAAGVMLDCSPANTGGSAIPLLGLRISGISLDGRDLQIGPTDTGATPCPIGLRLRACAGAHVSDLYLNGPFTTAALDLGALTAGTIGGTDTHGTLRCIFERFCIRQLDGAAPGIGIRFTGTATANVNFCKFDTFQIMYLGSSTRQPAIQLNNSDSNTFIMGACNRAGSGTTNWGVEILGSSVGVAEVSRANHFYHCSPGANGAFHAGTAAGCDPAGTAVAALNFTNPSTDNNWYPQSTENGEPVPRFGTGATGNYGISGGSTGPGHLSRPATLAVAVASVTITTVETSVMTATTVPANFMRAGTVFRWTVTGVLSNTVTSSTWTIRAKIGGVTVGTVTVTSSAIARTNMAFTLVVLATVRTDGAAGSAIANGNIAMAYGTQATPLVGTGVTATAAVNTTAAAAIDLTLIGATGTPSVTVTNAVLEALK